MSLSSDSNAIRKIIEITYADKKRSDSLKWSIINGVLFVVFSLDLWYKCAWHTSWLHYVEGAVAAVLAVNGLHHAVCCVRPSPSTASSPPPCLPRAAPDLDASDVLSLSRSWASSSGDDSRQMSSRSPPRARDSSLNTTPTADEFISDKKTLTDYLRQLEERWRPEQAVEPRSVLFAGGAAGAGSAGYQLAAATGARAAGGEEAGAWRRLRGDAARLSEHTRALRLWLHLTVLSRLRAQMRLVDVALAKHHAALGQVSVERLRKLSAAEESLSALLPFLEPFTNQQYLVQRIHELARGGCLSDFKWNGGGRFGDAEWDDSLPTDAEIVMHMFTTYMDTQLRVGAVPGGGVFTTRHTSRAPQRPPRAPGALVLHRSAASPPHYLLVHDEEVIELPQGRNNLLHTLLLFVAAATARGGELDRVQLGPAGLNLLWVLGR